MVERRLGRGLDFFLTGGPAPSGSGAEVIQVELDKLSPNPNQPRRTFDQDELDSLSKSIQSTGVLQPILARRQGERLEIVAGERRWRAAKLAGLDRIPAIVRDLNDELVAVYALVENLQRADLNAIEKARAFQRLLGLAKGTQEDVAKQVGLDRSTVANFLRLLELPEEVQAHVSRGTLTMGHARALLSLASSEEQKLVAAQIIKQKLSVRQVEELVKQVEIPAAGQPKPKRPDGKRPVWVQEIEDRLAEVLGVSVKVRYGRKRSQITLDCVGREKFEQVYEKLKSLEE